VDLVAKRGSSVYIAIAPFVDRSALQSPELKRTPARSP
jgi:hypothetical protein